MREKIVLLNTTLLSLWHEKERRGKAISGLTKSQKKKVSFTEIIIVTEVLYFGSHYIAVRKFPEYTLALYVLAITQTYVEWIIMIRNNNKVPATIVLFDVSVHTFFILRTQ